MDRRCIKGKRLLVLGGNTICNEMRRYADRYGVTLITAGNDPNALSHRYSDEQYYFDVADKNLLLSFVKDKQIDGILSFTSEPLLRKTIPTIVSTGLPYHYSQERWDTLMDKLRFKEAALRHGVPVLLPLTRDEAISLIENGKRVVVKPTQAAGSFGITVCDKVDMLDNAIEIAKKNSSDGKYFMERYLNGDFFHFELWCADGKRHVAISKDRIWYPNTSELAGQPFCDLYPSDHHIYYESLRQPIENLLDEIGLMYGDVWFQGIVEDGTPYVFDVGYRPTGTMCFKVPYRDMGVDMIAGQMDYALTGKWLENLSPLDRGLSKHYLTLAPSMRNGKIAKVEGIEKIKSLSYVYDYFQYYDEGDDFQYFGTFLQAFCRIFIEGTSREDLISKVKEVMSFLKITDESGQDMLLKSPEL